MTGPVERIEVTAEFGSYPVLCGSGVLDSEEPVRAVLRDRQVFVVSSEPILDLHVERLDVLRREASSVEVLLVPDGEAAKCVSVLEQLWQQLLDRGGKRDSVVVAFGGGSIGDLAGFAAGSFLRGIDLVQIPTTLLAQVDSSVGGKTGIDLPGAKNSVGAFVQPLLVLADTQVLTTLPRGELRAGLVESVKMAALLDGPFFERLERDWEQVLEFAPETLSWVVAGSVAMKAGVVAADPREAGARQLLNFGHTFGHALEAVTDYQGLRHGEAVAYGLLFALRLARTLRDRDRSTQLLQDDLDERLERLVRTLALPPLPTDDVDALVRAMARDKKARRDGLTWVLPERLGRGALVSRVPTASVEDLAREFVAEFCERPPRPA